MQFFPHGCTSHGASRALALDHLAYRSTGCAKKAAGGAAPNTDAETVRLAEKKDRETCGMDNATRVHRRKLHMITFFLRKKKGLRVRGVRVRVVRVQTN